MNGGAWVAVWPIGQSEPPKVRHYIEKEEEAWCLRPATSLCKLDLPVNATWYIGKVGERVTAQECPECREALDTLGGTHQ